MLVGPLGFAGKTGAILGVGIDCTGEFCEGHPASVAIRRASDNELLCMPVQVDGGVTTRTEDDHWTPIMIKFDIENNTCDVNVGDVKVLKDVVLAGVNIPNVVCIGVCARTTAGKTNRICVNNVRLGEDDDDYSITTGILEDQDLTVDFFMHLYEELYEDSVDFLAKLDMVKGLDELIPLNDKIATLKAQITSQDDTILNKADWEERVVEWVEKLQKSAQ